MLNACRQPLTARSARTVPVVPSDRPSTAASGKRKAGRASELMSTSQRLLTLTLACCAGGAILFSQTPAPPPGGPPAAPAQGAPGQGRGVVDPPGADFS